MNDKNDAETVSVSFVHISDDVIIPSNQLKYNNGLKFSCIFTYGFFGIIWFLILFATGPTSSFTWKAAGVLLGIATISELLNRWILFPWIEIDRKGGVINCWKNNKKRKLLSSYRKEEIKVTYGKILYNYKGGGSSYWLFVINVSEKKSRRLLLFSLPDKISEPQARAFTESVENFLKYFLSGKEIKPRNREYRFEIPHR